jgi:hypothetical protein
VIRRALAVLVLAGSAAGSWPAPHASAHQGAGSSVTADTRARIVSVSPTVAGLTVRVADLDGRIEVDWTGDGPLTVLGYEGEPYLRIDDDVVSRNTRSPATYLNDDRYAEVTVPPEASASAPPAWERIGTGTTVSWHDHRTHWMSPGTPPAARGSDAPVVLTPRWEIDLEAGSTPVVVAGDLTWLPPPNTWAWLAVSIFGGLALLAALLATGTWAAAALAGLIGGALFAVDSVGYLLGWSAGNAAGVWLVAAPVVALAGATRAWRRAPRPSAGLAVCGVVLTVVGGLDRLDVLRDPLVDSALPDWFTRVAACGCLAIGGALLVRCLIWLIPAALISPPSTTTTQHVS